MLSSLLLVVGAFVGSGRQWLSSEAVVGGFFLKRSLVAVGGSGLR